MNKKIYIEDLIREGNDAKALQYVVEKLQSLEKENTNLKYKIDYISEVAIQEKEQYMEALRKCSPLQLTDVCGFCLFCDCPIDEIDEGHAEDCEYIRLTKQK